jgi:predicted RNase H-like HicB family nuclease
MIIEYIEAALLPELEGVWATGKTLEECRKKLAEVIDGWIVVRLREGLPIPPIGTYKIEELSRLEIGVKV